MSSSIASITGASIAMNVEPALVTPMINTSTINLPINFANAQNVKQLYGVYTPANNVFAAHTFASNESPNFVFIVVDQLTVVNAKNSGGDITYTPITRFLYFDLTTLATPMTVINFDGRSNLAEPMAQGVPVNWFLVYGQATIS